MKAFALPDVLRDLYRKSGDRYVKASADKSTKPLSALLEAERFARAHEPGDSSP
jgi:hypothetical protein